MTDSIRVKRLAGKGQRGNLPVADSCILVIFGASGDLTKRLLMPALYNLWCDGLLSPRLAIVGIAMDPMTTEAFRAKMSADILQFNTRRDFDTAKWDEFVTRLHYTPGKFDDPAAYAKLKDLVGTLDAELGTADNVLFYMATPPSVFGLVSSQLDRAGFKAEAKGWRRIIVEKPFGQDLKSAIELNRGMLQFWKEDQIYRIDHYLGKETVQNILAFRFSNGMFEPLWNKHHVDHIQFNVSETVSVEGRGKYYDGVGVLRDMIQNHMFQMLAYLCMEPPTSFKADAIRNEKAKVLDAVRVMKPDEIKKYCVRGQYSAGTKADGKATVGYRQEPDVNPQSKTETFAALKLHIDNWRWEGVPIYVRSGKALWKRDTEILVQFKRAPEIIYQDVSEVDHLDSNQLIFHIQPDQGIELRFHAKSPGPLMNLQKVNMRFDYSDTFAVSRGTGYEVLIYNCMIGEPTLFSRSDLVESAWRIAQPILNSWAADAEITESQNYPAGSWGPKDAYDLIEQDGRKWLETINRDVLEKIPLFHGCTDVFLANLAMMLKPDVFGKGEHIIEKGEDGNEMYVLCRGHVEVLDDQGKVLSTMGPGDFFGETSLLVDQTRTATVRALTNVDLFVLSKADFNRVLRDQPGVARTIQQTCEARYQLKPS